MPGIDEKRNGGVLNRGMEGCCKYPLKKRSVFRFCFVFPRQCGKSVLVLSTSLNTSVGCCFFLLATQKGTVGSSPKTLPVHTHYSRCFSHGSRQLGSLKKFRELLEKQPKISLGTLNRIVKDIKVLDRIAAKCGHDSLTEQRDVR